jgi:hypothetical protein
MPAITYRGDSLAAGAEERWVDDLHPGVLLHDQLHTLPLWLYGFQR